MQDELAHTVEAVRGMRRSAHVHGGLLIGSIRSRLTTPAIARSNTLATDWRKREPY
jgi:hypothetical protein